MYICACGILFTFTTFLKLKRGRYPFAPSPPTSPFFFEV